MLRMPDLLRYVDQAGVRSLPLVVLLGYLIGLILAFQSAVPMRRFGADIYVANLVAISLVRELGALLAAVILAGRTGSAFAAEIGTMKVNEEVDALTTMGLAPVRFLVVPRVLAGLTRFVEQLGGGPAPKDYAIMVVSGSSGDGNGRSDPGSIFVFHLPRRNQSARRTPLRMQVRLMVQATP